VRLFAGIALDEATRTACAGVARRLELTGFEARYADPANLHITLAFLGNVEATRYDEIVAALDTAAAGAPRFSLTLDKLGAFPHERRPRVVYLGARDASASFRHLARAVRERYETMGFAFEDDNVAHVTIARVKGGSARPLPMLEISPVTLTVDTLVLFESVRAETMTHYAIRHASAMRS